MIKFLQEFLGINELKKYYLPIQYIYLIKVIFIYALLISWPPCTIFYDLKNIGRLLYKDNTTQSQVDNQWAILRCVMDILHWFFYCFFLLPFFCHSCWNMSLLLDTNRYILYSVLEILKYIYSLDILVFIGDVDRILLDSTYLYSSANFLHFRRRFRIE